MLNDEPQKKDGLELSQREVGQIVAALLLGAFFIFAGGYFFGKKKMLEEFSAQQNDACFADKMYNSVVALSEDPGSEQDQEFEDVSLSSVDETEISDEIDTSVTAAVSVEPQVTAYAQLCGFGTKIAAEKYQGRLQKRSLDMTHIVERKSKSKKGKVVHWYQVVTDPMAKEELLPIVEKIKKQDSLTGVKIVDLKADEA